MELDYHAIGVRVRRFRKELGMTQQTLAELSGQEPSNISHIERGATKLGLPTIVNIANVLGVTVNDLLCDSILVSHAVYIGEMDRLLSDCSHAELRIITETVRTLKRTMREVAPENKTLDRST